MSSALCKGGKLLWEEGREEIQRGLLAPPWFAMYLYQKALFSIPEGQSAIFDWFQPQSAEANLIVESLVGSTGLSKSSTSPFQTRRR